MLRWRDEGVQQHDARFRLEAVLAQPLEEADDDVVRDVLDEVLGFCNEDRRLYPD